MRIPVHHLCGMQGFQNYKRRTADGVLKKFQNISKVLNKSSWVMIYLDLARHSLPNFAIISKMFAVIRDKIVILFSQLFPSSFDDFI